MGGTPARAAEAAKPRIPYRKKAPTYVGGRRGFGGGFGGWGTTNSAAFRGARFVGSADSLTCRKAHITREAYITTGSPVISHLRKQIYHPAQSAAEGRPRAAYAAMPRYFGGRRGFGGGLGGGEPPTRRETRRTICRLRRHRIYSFFFFLYSLFFCFFVCSANFIIHSVYFLI